MKKILIILGILIFLLFQTYYANPENKLENKENDIDSYYKKAQFFLDSKDSESAMKEYFKIIELNLNSNNPDSSQEEKCYKKLWEIIGSNDKKDYIPLMDLFISKIEEILTKKIDSEFSRTQLIKAYTKLEKYEEILNVYRKQLLLQTNLSNVKKSLIFRNMSLIYLKLNQYALALDNFQRALKFNPQDTFSKSKIGIIYLSQRNFDKALNEFNQLIKDNPDNSYFRLLLSWTYFFKNEKEKSREEIEKVKSKDTILYQMLNILLQNSENKNMDSLLSVFEKIE